MALFEPVVHPLHRISARIRNFQADVSIQYQSLGFMRVLGLFRADSLPRRNSTRRGLAGPSMPRSEVIVALRLGFGADVIMAGHDRIQPFRHQDSGGEALLVALPGSA